MNAPRVPWVYPAQTGHIMRCAKGTARTPAPGSGYQRAQEMFLAVLCCPLGQYSRLQRAPSHFEATKDFVLCKEAPKCSGVCVSWRAQVSLGLMTSNYQQDFLSVIAAPLSKADGQKGSGAFLALLSSWVQPAWTRGWHHTGVPCKVLSLPTATGRQWQASEPPGHHQQWAPSLCRLHRQPHAVLIQCTGAQGGHTHPQCSHPGLISSADVRGLLGHEGTSCTRGRGPAHAPLAMGTGDRGQGQGSHSCWCQDAGQQGSTRLCLKPLILQYT